MASTFSPLLRIELIGAGEQAGAWNNTTNTNLGALIEEAISGVAAVSVGSSTSYTLTTANGATDEARSMVLNVTGTPGAAFNVICPTSDKVYIVKNGVATHAMTLKTSAGTGITIPSGRTMLLYCDGTNVVNGVDELPTGATVNGAVIATLTGTETLTNKTLTAPKFADGGFIADANGNEIVVLDTVTSAVNEITVANAATGAGPRISGTGSDSNIDLNLVPKGTGVVNVSGNLNGLRYLDVSNSDTNANSGSIVRLISSDVAGTGNAAANIVKYKNGAFTIANAETNAAAYTAFNVGASERMRIDSSGNVGIGAISGGARLDLAAIGSVTVYARVRNAVGLLDLNVLSTGDSYVTANTAGKYLGLGAGGSERFRIGPAGQFGIGGATYGTSGQVLTSGGASAAPSWSTAAAPAALSTASGSAPSYSARAWVNFNGSGTVAIRASGNVTSITDRGTGQYTVNLTTAMQDTNYAVVGTTDNSQTSGYCVLFVNTDVGTLSTTAVPVDVKTNGNDQADAILNSIAIFR
jgi:hypothetical protein